MPDGQYSFYLHSDDRTDIAAMATISTISQPLRGDFIRTAATAGAVVYHSALRCDGPGIRHLVFTLRTS